MSHRPVTEEVLDARAKLSDLRLTMENIKLRSPRHRVGDDPSAADACSQVFDSIDYMLRELEIFVG